MLLEGTLGNYSFKDCTSIEKFYMADYSGTGVTTKGTLDLSPCTSLKRVYLAGNGSKDYIKLPSVELDYMYFRYNVRATGNFSTKELLLSQHRAYGIGTGQFNIEKLKSNDGLKELSYISGVNSESLKSLELLGSNANLNSFSSLNDLGRFSNLTLLTITYAKELTSLSGIETLSKLESLTFTNCIVSDISALSGLTNLTTIKLSGNKISDITPLGNLKNITSLTLSSNSISDLSPLLGMIGDDGKIKFTKLDISYNSLEGYISATNNNVETLRQLHDAGLKSITITGNNFSTNDLNTIKSIFGTKNVTN